MRNRFAELASSGDNLNRRRVDTKKRMRKRKLAADPRVEEAPSEVQQAFKDYQIDTSNNHQQNLGLKKEELQKLYQMEERELSEMIMQVKNAGARSKKRTLFILI